MRLTSPAFEHNGTIPSKYTCDGSNVSPPLVIGEVVPETRSLVLLVDDPDAPGGTFIHWVVYDIPPDVRIIHENTDPGTTGTNSYQEAFYKGPCPPAGTHRYFFKLYALDRKLALSPGQSKIQVERAMTGLIIAQTELIGLYERV
jgi:Raf kinase inhibitor-like YbhB/YbcL family protein